MDGKVHGTVVRERDHVLRRIGAPLSRRVPDAQVGTVRPGLTLDDGTLVVTDNYLKVRIAPAGRGMSCRRSGQADRCAATRDRRPESDEQRQTASAPPTAVPEIARSRLGDQLTAGGADVAAARLADRHRHAAFARGSGELLTRVVGGTREGNAGASLRGSRLTLP